MHGSVGERGGLPPDIRALIEAPDSADAATGPTGSRSESWYTPSARAGMTRP